MLVLALVVLVAGVAAVAGPWFGHFGLPWPGGGGSGGSDAAASTTAAGNATGITVEGVGEAWYHAPVNMAFLDRGGEPVVVAWRVDGGEWHHGRTGRLPAPADHSNDGEHVVEVRAADGGPVATYKVRIDTTPPQIGDASVSPDRISGPKTVALAYDVPAADGVKVDWAVVDTLGGKVGEQGSPHAAAGAETVRGRRAAPAARPCSPAPTGSS